MHTSTGNPTDAQRDRFRLIQQIGCLACRLFRDVFGVPCDVHHLLSGGRRRGHDDTIGLCPWHHRGNVPEGFMTVGGAERWYGPSYAHTPRLFQRTFGTDDELLVIQNQLIELHRSIAIA